jgi:DNA-binding NarL/FixJ family response regulator
VIRVLVADEQKMFRQGLRSLFEIASDIEVVGETGNGIEVQDLVDQLQPDVILMDINMPLVDGIATTAQILDRHPKAAIIILTMSAEREHVFQAIKSGARGYLLKDADSNEVIQAIRSVALGGSVLDLAITGKLFSAIRGMSQASDTGNADGLTARELEILAHIAAGNSNREIAEKMSLSEKTIKNYLSAIFRKLQIKDRTQAAVYALQHGLINMCA